MKYRQQFDSSDCGAACVAMIASYFGMNINIAKTREIAGTDTEGTNIKGLMKVAKVYNLKCRAVQGSKKALNKELYTPFIVHLHIERENGNWVDHYAVVK
ncbi:MAG: peptidase domain-containing ABC transporter, partial [Treponema sp.]|nr:peptidase domain-containing ABC transporter [Clostridia bacterium]MCF0241812.1 peptidase domain-containing ABC transporter [Treponema sp.]